MTPEENNQYQFPLIPLPNKEATKQIRTQEQKAAAYRKFPLIPLPNKEATSVISFT